MNRTNSNQPEGGWRAALYIVIFGTETRAGRAFDVALLWVILLSVLVVMLESVESIRNDYHRVLSVLEWGVTGVFTLEYVLRLICVRRPRSYATSFFGIIDLLAILPTYLSLVMLGTHYLMVVRILRLVRVFRVLKLLRFLKEGHVLVSALRASRHKITVFLAAVMTLVVIMGTLMYLIEGEASGFTSIPRGIYWAIVTLSTVGYGDIAPVTPLGQIIACLVMILGYGIIAVPTGIVSVELQQATAQAVRLPVSCSACGSYGHDQDARWCRLCGSRLEEPASPEI